MPVTDLASRSIRLQCQRIYRRLRESGRRVPAVFCAKYVSFSPPQGCRPRNRQIVSIINQYILELCERRAAIPGSYAVITRRTATLTIAGAGISAAFAMRIGRARADSATQASPVVKTGTGSVQGSVQDGVLKFLGIPYGASTAGAARFMPPGPPAPWSGVRDAKAYGDSCPQVPLGLTPFAQKGAGTTAAPPSSMQPVGCFVCPSQSGTGMSEDCLVLNVWTSAARFIQASGHGYCTADLRWAWDPVRTTMERIWQCGVMSSS